MLCLLEQTRQLPAFDKQIWSCEVERLVARVDPNASAFHLTNDNETNLQALAVAQRSGLPTVNFVVGASPLAWTLFEAQVHPGRSRDEILAALRDYLAAQRIEPASVQVLEPIAKGECSAQ